MPIRLDERRYVEELKCLVADFRMWQDPLVPLPDGFEDDLVWRSYRVFGQTSPADIIALAVRTRDEDLVAQGEGFISDSVSMIDDEDVFGWLFRMIWGKELQLRQQIADADVEDLDAIFDFLTSACRLAAHVLLGWGEGDTRWLTGHGLDSRRSLPVWICCREGIRRQRARTSWRGRS